MLVHLEIIANHDGVADQAQHRKIGYMIAVSPAIAKADISAAIQHKYVDPNTLSDAAPALLAATRPEWA